MDLAADQAQNSSGNQNSKYKSLLVIERQRNATRRLKRILQKSKAGTLDKVLIRSEKTIKELIKKEEIEEVIHVENKKKYS